ncbi:hypothetical protein [Clostridium felsineum]|uniref:hypothetical protein n=1 Tax=Clostridium felsineum TaxID=36839 RepID=UPI00098CDC84|nr:hypothetical protein [Clostridium felsineum]URZ17121.1 hypothetical protein CLFE_031730 [Clostridium felsineum DSM 794]
MFKKIINTVSILIVLAYILVVIYGLYCNVPFKNEFSKDSIVLILYLAFFYLGKACLSDTIKSKKGPKEKKTSKTVIVIGSIFLVSGILLGVATLDNIYKLRIDSSEYKNGDIISVELKVKKITIETNTGGRGASRHVTTEITEIEGTNIRNNEKLEFKHCSFYVSEISQGQVYNVKYLKTTHRILNIQEKK